MGPRRHYETVLLIACERAHTLRARMRRAGRGTYLYPPLNIVEVRMPIDNPGFTLLFWYGSVALVGILCVLILLAWVEGRRSGGRHRGQARASESEGAPATMGRHAATSNRPR